MLELFDRTEDGLAPSEAEMLHFPAGEAHINNLDAAKPRVALIRGTEADDLIMLAMAANVAENNGTPLVALMPYLPAARADRGTPFGAKVYADLINTMGLAKVVCFDPHSPLMPSLVENIEILDTVKIIRHYVEESGVEYAGIISPDEGSRKRSGVIAAALGLPLICASKHRDFDTGKLSGFSVEDIPNPDGIYLVVDDICDGGGTFMGLAKATNLPKEQMHLWVSHGVFSGRAPQLKEAYSKVITTNSHPGCLNPEVDAEIVDIVPFLMELA